MKKINLILGCVILSSMFSCNSTQRAARLELEKDAQKRYHTVTNVEYNKGNVIVETEPIATETSIPSKSILDVYPPAKEGQERWVIWLTPLQNREAESSKKIEIIPGKVMRVDCNQHFLNGELKVHDLEGYGYPYYTFETNGGVGATRMLCPDNTTHEEFVKSEPKLIPYNSQLPLVIYAPKGYEIRVKTWSSK
ncbi:ecotin family protein [Weeksellaceae bacterium TAE3-ERU29]|nr:ecotin family protein [Weeksellaceae bacterium TAE3-ERU29]